MAPREFGTLSAHVDLKLIDEWFAERLADCPSFLGTHSVDRPLDFKQGVDAVHDLDRDRREHDLLLASSLSPSVLVEISHGKERTPGMDLMPSSA